jgi:putative membrane protein
MNTIKFFTKTALFAVVSTGLFSLSVNAQNNKKLTDPEIASVAVTANKIDINYANIALKKSKNSQVIAFAKTMAKDHQAVIDQAVALVTKLGVTPKDNATSESLNAGEVKTVKMLNSKSGNAFDKAYVDNEVAYHTAVINAVENVLIPDATNKELHDLLVSAVPLFKAHLEHAKMIQKNLGK